MMARKEMYRICLWQILVPQNNSQGNPFDLSHHRRWDKKVRAIAGGLTIFKSAKGQWVAGNKFVYTEPMIPVGIACSKEKIEKISNITAEHYKQKAVMYYLVSGEVFIKQYDN